LFDYYESSKIYFIEYLIQEHTVTPHKIKASIMTAKVLSSCVSHSIP